MQFLPVKVPLPAPGRTRNTLTVQDERKVILRTWKQARHSILANSFQGPGRRLQVLRCLTADSFIHCLYRVVVCDEHFPPVLLPAPAVFFSSPASRSSYEPRCRNALRSKQPLEPGQSPDSPSSSQEQTRALRP